MVEQIEWIKLELKYGVTYLCDVSLKLEWYFEIEIETNACFIDSHGSHGFSVSLWLTSWSHHSCPSLLMENMVSASSANLCQVCLGCCDWNPSHFSFSVLVVAFEQFHLSVSASCQRRVSVVRAAFYLKKFWQPTLSCGRGCRLKDFASPALTDLSG